MSSKSWLAIDAGTAPMVRAQELRFAWERFLDGDEGRHGERPRGDRGLLAPQSSAAGVDPTGARLAPVVADEDETHDRWAEHPLGERGAAHPRLPERDRRRAAGYLIVVSDAGRAAAEHRGLARTSACAPPTDMNFAEGTLWSEPGAGTNAIGTALAVDHAVQVFGPEHFSEPGAALDVQRGADPRPGHGRAARASST